MERRVAGTGQHRSAVANTTAIAAMRAMHLMDQRPVAGAGRSPPAIEIFPRPERERKRAPPAARAHWSGGLYRAGALAPVSDRTGAQPAVDRLCLRCDRDVGTVPIRRQGAAPASRERGWCGTPGESGTARRPRRGGGEDGRGRGCASARRWAPDGGFVPRGGWQVTNAQPAYVGRPPARHLPPITR